MNHVNKGVDNKDANEGLDNIGHPYSFRPNNAQRQKSHRQIGHSRGIVEAQVVDGGEVGGQRPAEA